ncbi:MAG: DUF2231 domain-containing protein [Flavisolibacter sp.]
MKSKASIGSHPLHPILVAFPIAFFIGTLVTHVLGWILERPALFYTAWLLNLAGITGAVLAAVPGLIDLIYVVPPKSSGKKTGVRHAVSNVIVLLLFSVAAIYRNHHQETSYFILALELVGTGLMTYSGWLGGTLVYRNQIGVDHRYAGAGKWNEAYFNSDSKTIEVATKEELKTNAMKLLHLNDKRIVLARTEKGYVAFDDHCTHKGGSLAGGSLACDIVQCPWHGSQFSVRTGEVKEGPAKQAIKTYNVTERENKVFLNLD